jgi:hypothetical protein
MSFRPATTADKSLFYEWRQISEAQGRALGYWDGEPITPGNHHAWYLRRLKDAHLLVWEHDGGDAGVARIDSGGEITFETGSQAPLLLEELKPFALVNGGRLKATIDEGDPKAEAFLAAGFDELPARFFRYRP